MVTNTLLAMSKVTFVLMKSHVCQSKQKKRNIVDDRVDITHQCLLALLDSPLSQSGNARIFIQNIDNVLIEVNHKTKIPRSLHRFQGLMQKLFIDRKIKSCNGEILAMIIKNPVSEYLPPNSIKFGLSQDAEKKDRSFFEENMAHGYVVFLNANQKSEDVFPDAEFLMKLSDYPLSAFVCCTKVCGIFEGVYDIF